jgi:hypothetical protein
MVIIMLTELFDETPWYKPDRGIPAGDRKGCQAVLSNSAGTDRIGRDVQGRTAARVCRRRGTRGCRRHIKTRTGKNLDVDCCFQLKDGRVAEGSTSTILRVGRVLLVAAPAGGCDGAPVLCRNYRFGDSLKRIGRDRIFG